MASDSADTGQYPVYLGVWTNWSRGQVLGLTLTLRRQEANLLVAFTAFFIAFIATRFWRVLCFAFHRLYATAASQNAIYHQRQAILRNSSTPEDGVKQLVQLIWTNRDRSDRFAPLLMAIIALFCIISFTAAGGLSSQISTAIGTEVLIRSLHCGILDRTIPGASDGSINDFFTLVPNKAELIDNAANYAQQFYATGTSGNLDCGQFVIKNLTRQIDYNAECPFEGKMCRSTSDNLRIDSGYISSREHLGINSPDKFFVRNLLHCAPITTAGYTSQRNDSIGNITLYHYGSIMTSSGWQDYVFASNSIESQYAFNFSPDYLVFGSSYGVSSTIYVRRNNTLQLEFAPISSVSRNDADVTIVFLSGEGVVHSAPSLDEWYRVSPTPVNVSETAGERFDKAPIYLPLEPASPLGCVDQYQFCYGDIQHCGLLSSFSDAVLSVEHLFNTTSAYDNSTKIRADSLDYFLSGFLGYQSTYIGEVIQQLGSASLNSKNSLTASFQGPLPSNQWQLDVIGWWDITKASVQAAYLRMVYFNPPDPNLLRYRVNFTSEGRAKLCSNQKIRSTAYTSFSVFGLLFTFIVGLLIALISYLLEPVSRILHQKRGFRTFAHLEWSANATLQLQRLAHEQLGFGTWSKGTEDIPVTEAGNLLGCLDISQPDYPVIYPPDKDCTPPTENQFGNEILEAVTSTTEVSDWPDSSAVSSYSNNSSSHIPEHAPQLPFIPATLSFTVEPYLRADEEEPQVRMGAEESPRVAQQFHGQATGGTYPR
ncbi:hypothetical protein GGR55DRAFT_703439 [Xylaria sp. FL0064]|nr:hypothetical protein GGR55DRAFT_703439 [Xylaria sp. FL0064]